MPTIIFVRHGENEYTKKGRLAGRLPGVHLNEHGQKQAQKLAEVLGKAPVKAIYASPLDRTTETAAPIAAALGLEVMPREGLLELDMGDWQGQTLKSLRRLKLWQTVQHRPSMMRFPNGETFEEAQHRIITEINALCKLHKPEELIICVGHSDMIKLAVAYYQGLPLDLFQRVMISTGSLTTIHVSEGGSMVIHINVPPVLEFPKMKTEKKEAKKSDQPPVNGKTGRS